MEKNHIELEKCADSLGTDFSSYASKPFNIIGKMCPYQLLSSEKLYPPALLLGTLQLCPFIKFW